MSEQKANILARLRQRTGNTQATAGTAPPVTRQPNWSQQERVARFSELLQAVRAEVHHTTATAWPGLLQRLCREQGIESLLYAPDGPIGAAIESGWHTADDATRLVTHQGPVDDWKDPLFFSIDATVTSARAGIARTGTLVLWPTPAEPRSWSLVPPIHIVVLQADAIHDTFAELIEQEGWHTGMPTNALLISGPSKTADIEQTLSYGIHGPVRLIVLVVEST